MAVVLGHFSPNQSVVVIQGSPTSTQSGYLPNHGHLRGLDYSGGVLHRDLHLAERDFLDSFGYMDYWPGNNRHYRNTYHRLSEPTDYR